MTETAQIDQVASAPLAGSVSSIWSARVASGTRRPSPASNGALHVPAATRATSQARRRPSLHSTATTRLRSATRAVAPTPSSMRAPIRPAAAANALTVAIASACPSIAQYTPPAHVGARPGASVRAAVASTSSSGAPWARCSAIQPGACRHAASSSATRSPPPRR